MIATVIRTGNGMVMVFDEQGCELPEYQGPYDRVKKLVLLNVSRDTVFEHWFGTELAPNVVRALEW